MTMPCDPLVAVTHHDPYPYYAVLLQNETLYRDAVLDMWIATSATAVTTVLEHPSCRVRPDAEPVPVALQGTPVGELFASLVRMTDGESHCPLKQAVTMALTSLDRHTVAVQGTACTAYLFEEITPLDHAGLTEFTMRLPAYTVAALLGFPSDHWAAVAGWTRDLARCIAPGVSQEQLELGQHAVSELKSVTRRLIETSPSASPNLLGLLTSQARARSISNEATIANAIGLLLQTYEATAGLIGNTLVTLGRDSHLLAQIKTEPQRLRSITREVLRHDPPIQNTRRFVSQDEMIAGQPMRAGDTILVVLAAANRDPARFTDPDRFDPSRQQQHCFTFGQGRHACPGETLALDIAETAVAQLLKASTALSILPSRVVYRESLNARIPLFSTSTAA